MSPALFCTKTAGKCEESNVTPFTKATSDDEITMKGYDVEEAKQLCTSPLRDFDSPDQYQLRRGETKLPCIAEQLNKFDDSPRRLSFDESLSDIEMNDNQMRGE